MKKLIAFDVDGTVLDTLDTIIHHVNESLHENGFYRVDDREYFREVLGYGASYLIEKALIFPYNHIYDKNLTEEVTAYYTNRYKNNPDYLTKPFDGMVELLQDLKERGHILVAYSNKPDKVLQATMSKLMTEGLFDFVTGLTDGMKSKPDPSELEKIMKEFNVTKEEVCYVGDSEVDIETAKNIGVTSVAVTWGFKNRDFLETYNPDHFADTMDELREVLFSL